MILLPISPHYSISATVGSNCSICRMASRYFCLFSVSFVVKASSIRFTRLSLSLINVTPNFLISDYRSIVFSSDGLPPGSYYNYEK